ncbi:MAG: cation:proton antiporter, partial [Dehalococcoidia bacterium]|nr:cation:proton antiporter [Dehalococcoidia bacterium]
MIQNLVLALGVMIVAGILGSLVLRRVGLPSVTAYILVGVLIGPSVGRLIPVQIVESLDSLTSIALGVVAYLIGGSLRLNTLKGMGRMVAWVTLLQSVGAWILVTVVFSLAVHNLVPGNGFWEFSFPMAFIVGAISSATAPAATMAIVRELRARGPLTTTLLAVVALDDGVAVVAYSLAVGVAVALAIPGATITAASVIIEPLRHIGMSVALGTMLAPGIVLAYRHVHRNEIQLAFIFGSVLLCVGVALALELSLIMANMVLGFIVVNVLRATEEPSVLGDMETVLYTLFFVLAGLHFDLKVLGTAGMLALIIVLSRCSGKYAGTVIGSMLTQAPDTIRRYLGLALLPKAGVTVGLALLAAARFPTFGDLMLNAVLASTIINELIAPP